MQIEKLYSELGLTLFTTEIPETRLKNKISGVICGDLLSYIMANASSGDLWLTVQGHQNIIAVGSLSEMAGIVITGGIKPAEATIKKASEEGLPLLGTEKKTFAMARELIRYNL